MRDYEDYEPMSREDEDFYIDPEDFGPEEYYDEYNYDDEEETHS